MASFTHTVTLPLGPEDVFPWLLEPDKVPRWTTKMETYEQIGDGPIGRGTRLHQVLVVGDHRLDVELEVVRYEPPHSAESRFSLHGLDVVTVYTLTPADGGSELTQTLEGRATSFKARLLLPIVKPRLERKLTEDLERLREVLASA